ncbi:MAG TPA: twin-arginine translocase TatA/TatE family subunit [Gemmatimonadaceae bacterium]|nr:twin-arginine translocase TatA/TatE family subunit [Gemmatimonadaceae bacterium]
MTEILLILVVVLLLFGAKRIPEIAGSFGKGIREFKKSVSDTQSAITEPPRDDEARLRRPDSASAARSDAPEREPKRLM